MLKLITFFVEYLPFVSLLKLQALSHLSDNFVGESHEKSYFKLQVQRQVPQFILTTISFAHDVNQANQSIPLIDN